MPKKLQILFTADEPAKKLFVSQITNFYYMVAAQFICVAAGLAVVQQHQLSRDRAEPGDGHERRQAEARSVPQALAQRRPQD